MCIRDRTNPYYKGDVIYRGTRYKGNHPALVPAEVWYQVQSCLLYTSDAADERSSVDLGGRRIIKKKNIIYTI